MPGLAGLVASSTGPAVLTGDLNAPAEAPEIGFVLIAGLVRRITGLVTPA